MGYVLPHHLTAKVRLGAIAKDGVVITARHERNSRREKMSGTILVGRFSLLISLLLLCNDGIGVTISKGNYWRFFGLPGEAIRGRPA
jgi:hypothetical protein